MRRTNLTIDTDLCITFKYLTYHDAGVLIKAVMKYWKTGKKEIRKEDAILEPIFMRMLSELKEQREQKKFKLSKRR